MPRKKSNLQLIPKLAGSGRNILPYIIALIGAAAALMQGGIWAAMAVFVIALIAGTTIDIHRR